jgi:hypothetical protein
MQQNSLAALLDDGTKLEAEQLSSTQHRLCLYHAEENVPFEAHTDTTFLTLIPCAAIAGLEVCAFVCMCVCVGGGGGRLGGGAVFFMHV